MERSALMRGSGLLLIGIIMIAMASTTTRAQPQAPASMPPGAAPPPNITQILVYGGDFSIFINLLMSSGVGAKFQMQADNPDVGISIFAPKDIAFTKEPTATLLRDLTPQQLEALLEYHALPNWQSLAVLQQKINSVTPTFATYSAGGEFKLTISMVLGQVQLDTGRNVALITSTRYDTKPLSVYGLDDVLLPVDIFGPAAAPAPTAGGPSPAPASSPLPWSAPPSASLPSAEAPYAAPLSSAPPSSAPESSPAPSSVAPPSEAPSSAPLSSAPPSSAPASSSSPSFEAPASAPSPGQEVGFAPKSSSPTTLISLFLLSILLFRLF
ncbi:hypothetical protein KP509_12G007400 [Ceratopteris richardii]|uniref:FAS1 domain-containing protein n=1 Tax=Ceratopteris richardii TaxID=49495 RepID=A0A8T2TGI3_CERRI|nr:hypothetical protein KP509_12G007400 [Ceratopteris richardii]